MEKFDHDLVEEVTHALKDILAELRTELPFTERGAEVMEEMFIKPESLDGKPIKYAEDYVLAATVGMVWNNRPEYCILADRSRREGIAEFAEEADYDDPTSEIKPTIFVDALAFIDKPAFTEAILTEVWKALCSKDTEYIAGRQKIANSASVVAGIVGTKLSAAYGMVPVAMTALVCSVMLFAAKIGLRTFCGMLTDQQTSKSVTN